MRIGLVSDTYTPQVNGVTTVVRRIAALLAAQGHEVGIVAPRYAEFAPSDGFPELRVPSVAFPLYPAVRLSLPRARAVAAFFDAFRPDLLHVHTEGPLGLIGRRYALRRRLPLVTTFHTNFPEYSRHYGAGLLEPEIWGFLQWFHRPARVTYTPGEAIRAAGGRPLALVELPDPYAFPSGHAAAATSLAVTLAVAHPLLAPVTLPLAATVAYSRVALRVHHVSDVLAGAALGLGGAIAASRLLY